MVRTWLSGKNWKRGSGEGEEEFPRLVIKLGTRLGSGVKHGIIRQSCSVAGIGRGLMGMGADGLVVPSFLSKKVSSIRMNIVEESRTFGSVDKKISL